MKYLIIFDLNSVDNRCLTLGYITYFDTYRSVAVLNDLDGTEWGLEGIAMYSY